MQDDLFSDAIEQLLAGHAPPTVVRAIEAGGAASGLWDALEGSGFVDALVPEHAGGAGMGLREAFTLFQACGRHVLPMPLAQTAVARAVLSGAGVDAPLGPIALASAARVSAPLPVCYGAVADWVLLDDGSSLRLLATSAAHRQVTPRSVDATLAWDDNTPPHATCAAPAGGLRALEASVLAAQMSGAIRQLLDMTLRYANERQQFGRCIGKFQAIQHQLALMAQHAEAAHMAARMACSGSGVLPDPLLAAVAKASASEAVVPVTAVAHAVHGAIGITEEFDLQIYTRRLHAWRAAAGSETHWHRQVGRALLACEMDTPSFARTRLSP